MSSFAKEEVIKVAQALLKTAIRWEEAGNSYGDYDKTICQCCFKSLSDHAKEEKFPHDLDCPVLMAQDLLTGAP